MREKEEKDVKTAAAAALAASAVKAKVLWDIKIKHKNKGSPCWFLKYMAFKIALIINFKICMYLYGKIA